MGQTLRHEILVCRLGVCVCVCKYFGKIFDGSKSGTLGACIEKWQQHSVVVAVVVGSRPENKKQPF